MKTALTAAEIAALGLPGLDPERPKVVITDRVAIQRRADSKGWPFEERKERGGGRLYPIATMPQPWREALTAAIAKGKPAVLAALGLAPIVAPIAVSTTPPAAAETAPKPGPILRRAGRKTLALKAPAPEALSGRQARVRDARAALLVEIDRLAPAARLKRAIKTLLAQIADGSLRPALLALVPVANDRAGRDGARTLSLRTIMRWRALREEGGVDALAPLPCAETDTSIPPWAPFFLVPYQQPQKRSAKEVWGDLVLPEGVERPSYDQVRRFLAKLAPYSRERGRCGPNALKAYRAHTTRDTSQLWPTAVYISDGHTFKSRVQHPIHSQLFKPEITPVIDVYTRAVVGWSVGIVENSIGVLEALSSAMAPAAGQPGGVPAVFYSDLGKGFKNEKMSADASGFYARWGIVEEHSRARNSQARGIIEHFHGTVLTPAAKALTTYVGDDMDKDAIRLIDKANAAATTEGKPLPYTVTWPDFVDHIRQRFADYNNRPHSALPEIREADGRRRHLTPLEAWARGIAQGGYQPMVVEGSDVADLMRPYEIRKTRRGMVHILGLDYYARALEQFHDQAVMVGFDIHDTSRVWVREIESQKLLAVADLYGNARPYFAPDHLAAARASTERAFAARTAPRSFAERTQDSRTAGRLARNERDRQEILAEQAPQLTLVAESTPLSPEQQALGDAAFERIAAKAARRPDLTVITVAPTATEPSERPIFADDKSLAVWLAAHPDAVTADDVAWLRERLGSRPFRTLLEFADVDIAALSVLAWPDRAPRITPEPQARTA